MNNISHIFHALVVTLILDEKDRSNTVHWISIHYKIDLQHEISQKTDHQSL